MHGHSIQVSRSRIVPIKFVAQADRHSPIYDWKWCSRLYRAHSRQTVRLWLTRRICTLYKQNASNMSTREDTGSFDIHCSAPGADAPPPFAHKLLPFAIWGATVAHLILCHLDSVCLAEQFRDLWVHGAMHTNRSWWENGLGKTFALVQCKVPTVLRTCTATGAISDGPISSSSIAYTNEVQ